MTSSQVNHPPSSHLVSCQQNSTRGRAGPVWNRRSLWWRLKQKQKVRDEEESECLFIKCLRAGHLGVEQICFQTHWICADDLGAFDERQWAGRIVKVFHVTIFTFCFYHETIIVLIPSSPPSNTRTAGVIIFIPTVLMFLIVSHYQTIFSAFYSQNNRN